MKNLIVIATAAAVLCGGYVLFKGESAEAGIFDSIATSDWPVKQSKAFKVEAYGFDFRVYEWQTESDPNTFCTVAIGNSNSSPYMGLNCFQKSQ